LYGHGAGKLLATSNLSLLELSGLNLEERQLVWKFSFGIQ
jgi:hypothetical protein